MTLWIAALLLAQHSLFQEQRPPNTDNLKQARDLGKQGSDAIPQLVKLYDDANADRKSVV